MMLLGLLLMVASAAFVGLLIADNLAGGPEYQVTVLGNEIATLDGLGIFLAGLALALVFCLGAAMMRLARRARRPARPAAYEEPAYRGTAYDRTGPAPEERAAEQGGRAAGAPAEPRRGGWFRHLPGH